MLYQRIIRHIKYSELFIKMYFNIIYKYIFFIRNFMIKLQKLNLFIGIYYGISLLYFNVIDLKFKRVFSSFKI